VHEFLTEKIFPRQAHVIASAELKDALGRADVDGWLGLRPGPFGINVNDFD
jgi:hypothetical protein